MNEKIIKPIAQRVSEIFSPLLIPTFGVLLIMNFIPSVELYSLRLRLVLVAIVVCSTCLIPLSYLFVSNLNQRLFKEKRANHFNMLFYLFSCLSVFLGAQLLGRLPITGIFKLLLLGTCFVLLIDFLLSFKWNISEHTSLIGGLWGTLIALNFRYGVDIVWALMIISILSGMVGSAKIILNDHTPAQVYSGFVLGAFCMFAFLFFT